MSDITTVRLPHTGLRVPDRSITLAGYRARRTADGAWFRACVHLGGAKVGVVENMGFGGPTGLIDADPHHPIYGDVFAYLDGYARRCLTEEGDPVTNLEMLLDEVVAEHEWILKVADAGKKGKLLLRLMDHTVVGDDHLPVGGFPPRPAGDTLANIPPTAKHWAALGKALTETPELAPGQHGWWQAWTGVWRDVTVRPVRLNIHLYN